MAENKMNMLELTIPQFARLIKEDMEDEEYSPFIGIGLSGIGKTECIFDLTKELGVGFSEMRLVTMTETDLLGIPTIVDGRTTFASNDLLPKAERDGECGILVLDEITSVTNTLRAAVYQLMDSKRALGNYRLPPKWKVVALGNGPDDGGVFVGTENAFLSRGKAYRIVHDVESWKKWAVSHNVNPSVVAFISQSPENLHKFQGDPSDPNVFPCPRQWAHLGKKLNDRERRKGGLLEKEDVLVYAAGCVGEATAHKFTAFYVYNKELINPADILSGEALKHKRVIANEAYYITIQNLVQSMYLMLKDVDVLKGNPPLEITHKLENACAWVADLSNRSLDMAIMAIQDFAKNIPGFVSATASNDDFDCPSYVEMAKRNHRVFTD